MTTSSLMDEFLSDSNSFFFDLDGVSIEFELLYSLSFCCTFFKYRKNREDCRSSLSKVLVEDDGTNAEDGRVLGAAGGLLDELDGRCSFSDIL